MRLLHPWNCPGKSTGVGCHFLLQGIFPTQGSNTGRHFTIWTTREDKIESENFSVVSKSLQPHGLHSPWNSLGQNTGVGSLSLLQGNFPIQGLNPGLPHCWCILYQLSHSRSPAGKSGGHGEGSCWHSQGLPGLHRNWIQEHYKKE